MNDEEFLSSTSSYMKKSFFSSTPCPEKHRRRNAKFSVLVHIITHKILVILSCHPSWHITKQLPASAWLSTWVRDYHKFALQMNFHECKDAFKMLWRKRADVVELIFIESVKVNWSYHKPAHGLQLKVIHHNCLVSRGRASEGLAINKMFFSTFSFHELNHCLQDRAILKRIHSIKIWSGCPPL